jgi:hypothetical protein
LALPIEFPSVAWRRRGRAALCLRGWFAGIRVVKGDRIKRRPATYWRLSEEVYADMGAYIEFKTAGSLMV